MFLIFGKYVNEPVLLENSTEDLGWEEYLFLLCIFLYVYLSLYLLIKTTVKR